MDLQRMAYLFQFEPVGATFVIFLVAIAAVAAVVAAYVGACSARDMLKKRREERLRELAFAQQARSR